MKRRGPGLHILFSRCKKHVFRGVQTATNATLSCFFSRNEICDATKIILIFSYVTQPYSTHRNIILFITYQFICKASLLFDLPLIFCTLLPHFHVSFLFKLRITHFHWLLQSSLAYWLKAHCNSTSFLQQKIALHGAQKLNEIYKKLKKQNKKTIQIY